MDKQVDEKENSTRVVVEEKVENKNQNGLFSFILEEVKIDSTKLKNLQQVFENKTKPVEIKPAAKEKNINKPGTNKPEVKNNIKSKSPNLK